MRPSSPINLIGWFLSTSISSTTPTEVISFAWHTLLSSPIAGIWQDIFWVCHSFPFSVISAIQQAPEILHFAMSLYFNMVRIYPWGLDWLWSLAEKRALEESSVNGLKQFGAGITVTWIGRTKILISWTRQGNMARKCPAIYTYTQVVLTVNWGRHTDGTERSVPPYNFESPGIEHPVVHACCVARPYSSRLKRERATPWYPQHLKGTASAGTFLSFDTTLNQTKDP